VRVPYVIDDQATRLADVLANLLDEHHGKSLDADLVLSLRGD